MTETHLHGTIFIDGNIGVSEYKTPDWPVSILMGTVDVRLTEDQAVALESQLVHVLAGLRVDALLQS